MVENEQSQQKAETDISEEPENKDDENKDKENKDKVNKDKENKDKVSKDKESKDKRNKDNEQNEQKEEGQKPAESPEGDEESDDKPAKYKSQVQFNPVLYNFRSPPVSFEKRYALQMPFALLFDNLITVLWSVYGQQEDKKILSGINQLQWALEFLKCLKEDYTYPESIRNIVNDLEKQLIDLYAKVGAQMKKNAHEPKEEEIKSESSAASEATCVSLNEKDIMTKLDSIAIPLDPSGEPKALKELNSLGRRKTKQDTCNNKEDTKSSKSYMIGALQKILNKTSEEQTKSDVEELIKGLKVNSGSSSTRK